MEWISKFLVTLLVVTGVFVAIASRCQLSAHVTADGGSCSTTLFDAPAIPHADLAAVEMPSPRFDLVAILIVVAAIIVPGAAPGKIQTFLQKTKPIPRRISFSRRD